MIDNRIAIDLLWLRPGKVGGTEFFVRNLLDGMLALEERFHFVLLVSKDNERMFEKYLLDVRFEKLVVNIASTNISKRIIWQNFFQNHLLRKYKIYKCFVPVYCRPFLNIGVSYITVIHDIQAYHFPHYHPYYEVWYSKLCWIVDKYFNKHIIVTSEFVKNELINIYHIKEEKITVIGIPVLVDLEADEWKLAERRYNIVKKEYYYTIGQMIPHKNMDTLIKVFSKVKEKNIKKIPCKLLISGIAGEATQEINQLIKIYGLSENIILTNFVSDEMKFTLYKHCKNFLFPSVFEGFGIPPIEAMMCGANVITTNCASIPEVTQGKAVYVKNPYNVGEWINAMLTDQKKQEEINFKQFDKVMLAKKYLERIELSLI